MAFISDLFWKTGVFVIKVNICRCNFSYDELRLPYIPNFLNSQVAPEYFINSMHDREIKEKLNHNFSISIIISFLSNISSSLNSPFVHQKLEYIYQPEKKYKTLPGYESWRYLGTKVDVSVKCDDQDTNRCKFQ